MVTSTWIFPCLLKLKQYHNTDVKYMLLLFCYKGQAVTNVADRLCNTYKGNGNFSRIFLMQGDARVILELLFFLLYLVLGNTSHSTKF